MPGKPLGDEVKKVYSIRIEPKIKERMLKKLRVDGLQAAIDKLIFMLLSKKK